MEQERLLWFLCDYSAHDCGICFLALIWGVQSVSPRSQKSSFRWQSKALQPHCPHLPGQPCLMLASCLSAVTASVPAPAGAGESSHAVTCINTSCRSQGCWSHTAADTGGNKAISDLPAAPAACKTPGQLGHSLPPPHPSTGMESVMLQ